MVSILLSAYNAETHLKVTLASIGGQTYSHWELVAVDDGSTDRSLSLLQRFQQQHPEQVRILRNEKNLGLTKSLIRAADAARGEYLARIDAGDVFLPMKLEQQISYLERNPEYGIVGCNYVNVFLPSLKSKRSIAPLRDHEIRTSILRKNPFAHSAVVLRKSIYQKAGGYDANIQYGQDYDLWFRIIRETKAANLGEYLCERFMDENSISFQKQRSQMWQVVRTRWKYMNKFHIAQYVYFFEPLFFVVTPQKIIGLLRRHF